MVLLFPLLAMCGEAVSKTKSADEPPSKAVVKINAEENLGKIYLKLPSQTLISNSNGEADGLLRAVPWRTIGVNGPEKPLVRFSFGPEFKPGSAAAEALAKAGGLEPFFAEQRVVQCTAEDCKALLRLVDSLETAKFDKAPESITFRSISAGYGDFLFKKGEDDEVTIFAYPANSGEIWAAVDLQDLRKMIGAILVQLETFEQSPETISIK